MKNNIRLLLLCLGGFLFFSCISTEGVGKLAQFGGQIAAAVGVIDTKTADSIGKAGAAIASAAEEITPQQEYYIGRAVAATILTSYKTYSTAPLQKYLNEVCAAIVINSPKPELYKGYYVQVLDSKEINAFATSGGHIMITRGLLACVDSEDAAAAVIAHEIAHIQLRHGIRAIKASRTTAAITATAQAGFSASGIEELENLSSALDDGVGEVIHSMVNSGYSQTQEFDADENALELMTVAGYEPSAMNDMLTLLKQKEGSAQAGFFKTHPKPADRIKKVNKLLATQKSLNVNQARMARFVHMQAYF